MILWASTRSGSNAGSLARATVGKKQQAAMPFPRFKKRLKGKNPEGKNFRKLLRRKQSSAKISKISRNTIKSSKSDIFYLPRNLLKYLLRTFFSSAKFSEVFTLCVFTLWLFPSWVCRPAREPKTGKPPKVLPRVLSGTHSEVGVLPRVLPGSLAGRQTLNAKHRNSNWNMWLQGSSVKPRGPQAS